MVSAVELGIVICVWFQPSGLLQSNGYEHARLAPSLARYPIRAVPGSGELRKWSETWGKPMNMRTQIS